MRANSPWTDEMMERLRELVAEGLSASQIGSRLGLTRNSIIGRMSRMKIAKVKPSIHVEHRPVIRKAPLVPRPVPVSPHPFIGPVNDFPNSRYACRFMRVVKAGWQCCGQDTVGGTSWCEFHLRIVKPQPRAA